MTLYSHKSHGYLNFLHVIIFLLDLEASLDYQYFLILVEFLL